MVDAAQMNPDVTLDLSGVSCPGPIIGAKKLVSELAEGEILLLISDCPATNEELHTWAERTGNSVVKTQRMAGGHTGYYLRRGRRVQAQPHVSLDMRGSVCPGPILEARKVFAAMASGEL
ncbi:MAG: sulfurtransferase TusA family protein, partial [Quisquiliibacterium sp.]